MEAVVKTMYEGSEGRIVCCFEDLTTMRIWVEIQQSLSQRMWPDTPMLLQFPFMTETIVAGLKDRGVDTL